MSVLFMRLAGPMQSWGTRSRFSQRETGLEPSRSGVIGLLCAALGRPRAAPLDDFRPLRMAVRVDREGRLMRDYHTAQRVRWGDPTKETKETVLSERYYLADADFVVGLEGERAFLELLYAALRRPVWPLYLGRKAFVPALPVAEDLREGALLDVLRSWPWRKRYVGDAPVKPLRGIRETAFGAGEPRPDVPRSFVSRDRHFDLRYVQVEAKFANDFPILEPDAEAADVPQQADREPS